MIHRPTVKTVREGSVTFVPTCACGWEGIPVEKLSSLRITTGSFVGSRSLATNQLKNHINNFSAIRIPSNVTEIKKYA